MSCSTHLHNNAIAWHWWQSVALAWDYSNDSSKPRSADCQILLNKAVPCKKITEHAYIFDPDTKTTGTIRFRNHTPSTTPLAALAPSSRTALAQRLTAASAPRQQVKETRSIWPGIWLTCYYKTNVASSRETEVCVWHVVSCEVMYCRVMFYFVMLCFITQCVVCCIALHFPLPSQLQMQLASAFVFDCFA